MPLFILLKSILLNTVDIKSRFGVASFEEWIYTEDQKYDVIYSDQAFHWINKDIKYQKCYKLVKDKG